MGFHTYDVDRADALEDPARYDRLGADELRALVDPTGRVLDVGSGTGFYTDDVAPHADAVVALDVQAAMHDRYREKGLPPTVHPVTGEAASLPFRDAAFDRVVSTMTFHEFATPAACRELARVLAADGVAAIVDWSASGPGVDGPPPDERHDLAAATAMLSAAGLTVERGEERGELLVLRARRHPD